MQQTSKFGERSEPPFIFDPPHLCIPLKKQKSAIPALKPIFTKADHPPTLGGSSYTVEIVITLWFDLFGMKSGINVPGFSQNPRI